jgi:hypothetical protein
MFRFLIPLISFTLIIPLGLIFLGCFAKPSDRNWCLKRTLNDLKLLSQAAQNYVNIKQSFPPCHSLADLVSVLEKDAFLIPNTHYQLDGWGNPYTYEFQQYESCFNIRITANGNNEQFENGQGDDLQLLLHYNSDASKLSVTLAHPDPES